MTLKEILKMKNKEFNRYFIYSLTAYIFLIVFCIICYSKSIIIDNSSFELDDIDFLLPIAIINIFFITYIIFYLYRKIRIILVLLHFEKNNKIQEINDELNLEKINQKNLGTIFTKNYIISFDFTLKILEYKKIDRIYIPIRARGSIGQTKCILKRSKKIYTFFGNSIFDELKIRVPNVKIGSDGTEEKQFFKLLILIIIFTFIIGIIIARIGIVRSI